MDDLNKYSKLILKHFAEKYKVDTGFLISADKLGEILDINELLIVPELQDLHNKRYIKLESSSDLWMINLNRKGYETGKQLAPSQA